MVDSRLLRPTFRMLACLLLLTGCAGPGQLLSLFPDRYPMTKTAKALRQSGPSDQPRELVRSVLSNYILEPGDGLLIIPSDLDSPVRIPADHTVLPDGTIDLGRYGRHAVAGKSISEVEELVQEVVKKQTKEPGFIDVRLVNRQSKVYYVLGEVHTSGSFPLNGRETVLDAVVAAGGLTDRASTKNIILVRPGTTGCGDVLGVSWNRIVQLGETDTNYQIQPGDRVFVPSKGILESLTGSLSTE